MKHTLDRRILYVNLSSGERRDQVVEESPDFLLLGGLNAKLALDCIPPSISPLAAENAIIIGAGPLVGTDTPAGNKTVLTTKGALTETIVSAPAGHFGHQLRAAGWDHLVIQGRCKEPSILIIDDDQIRIQPALEIWGRDMVETSDALAERFPRAAIAAIGPAGENQVSFAIILINKQAMWSRGGTGAVMGSKNLKAIVVRGSRVRSKADPAGFRALVSDYNRKMNASSGIDRWREMGLFVGWESFVQNGQMVYDNFRRALSADACTRQFGPQIFLSEVLGKTYACPSCTVRCKHHISLKKGPYKGLDFFFSDFLGAVELGVRCGLENYGEVAVCADLLNRMGLECLTVAACLEYLMDMYRLGKLKEGDFDYIPKRGFKETLALIKDISYRRGIGELISQGWRKITQYFGNTTEAVLIKGIDPSSDSRIHMGTEGLGKFTSHRGAHANRALSVTQSPGRSPRSIMRYAGSIGIPDAAKARLYQGEADALSLPLLLKWTEDYNTLLTYLGLCIRAPHARLLSTELAARFLECLTGLEIDETALLRAGERIWNLERLFNVREGFSRDDDNPPYKWMNETIRFEGLDYPPLDKNHVTESLDSYYEERGWDICTGFPGEQKLKDLGLEEYLPIVHLAVGQRNDRKEKA